MTTMRQQQILQARLNVNFGGIGTQERLQLGCEEHTAKGFDG